MQVTNEKLYTLTDVLRILNIPRHKIHYLFDSRKLKKEAFFKMPNGHIIYRESDIQKIREALFEVQAK